MHQRERERKKNTYFYILSKKGMLRLVIKNIIALTTNFKFLRENRKKCSIDDASLSYIAQNPLFILDEKLGISALNTSFFLGDHKKNRIMVIGI